jgi:uncharacterized protein with FMN-binding domain
VRARVIAGGIVSSAAVLVIGWQLGGQPAVTTPAQQSTTSGTGTSGTGASGSSTTSGGSTASGTFTGDTAETQFGPVQVQIVVSNGKITAVTALQLTDRDGRSVQISQQAAPILQQEALQAQSASIQSVSGATYTSEGYTTSLQSAIDKAGL